LDTAASSTALTDWTMTTQTYIDQVSNIIGRKVICTLDDGRTLEGRLECLDRLSNIILRQALEKRIVKDLSIYQSHSGELQDTKELVIERKLSQALIPGNHLVKVLLI
jgi:small nuclear ribonucleoprotein (snRNP)-like protein